MTAPCAVDATLVDNLLTSADLVGVADTELRAAVDALAVPSLDSLLAVLHAHGLSDAAAHDLARIVADACPLDFAA